MTRVSSSVYKSPEGRQAVEAGYRQSLSRWPIPAEQRVVSTGAGPTFVIDSGPRDAPAVVLLHGSGANSMIWAADVPVWAEHRRVVAVDVIGEPGLSAPSRPELGSEAYAAWLDDVLDALGVADVALVGTSLGGWIALDFATRRPGRVRELVCLCPGGIGRQKYGWVFKALMYKPFGRLGIRRTFQAVTGLTGPLPAGFLDSMVLVHSQFKPRRERLPVFPDSALAGLSMPVMVIVGEDDAMLDSRETARRVRQALPNASVRLLPGVGHAVVGQTEVIDSFLLSPPPE